MCRYLTNTKSPRYESNLFTNKCHYNRKVKMNFILTLEMILLQMPSDQRETFYELNVQENVSHNNNTKRLFDETLPYK